MTKVNSYDAIIVGSGIGGLAAAAVLARVKKYRVLVLEQHFKLGGFTHTFQRPGGYHWDVGLHYVGEMEPGSPLRKAMDFITGGQVDWIKMKDPFETFLYPGLRFEVPSDRELYLKKLSALFPMESSGLRDYFNDLDKADATLKSLSNGADHTQDELILQSLRFYLESHFKDERLRGLLASQWGNYGLPPRSASFGIHATIIRHYLKGGYYPIGSAARLASSVSTLIQGARGDLRVRNRVVRVMVENDKAMGVEVENSRGRELILAPEIYSNAGAVATYGKLVADQHVGWKEKEELESTSTYGVVTLYLGLKSRCEHLGIHGQNFWIYDSFDHDSIWERRNALVEGSPSSCYLSFPGIKDPSALKPTAEIIAPLDYDVFRSWVGKLWRNRGSEYEAMKNRITEALLDFVESRLPGFRAEVAYAELSTPLTVESFTGHREGGIYGFPGIARRYGLKSLRPRTPLKGLVLVGADAGSLGIAGSMMSGIMGVATQHGMGILFKVLTVNPFVLSDKLEKV